MTHIALVRSPNAVNVQLLPVTAMAQRLRDKKNR
jgi:hypothetical protein